MKFLGKGKKSRPVQKAKPVAAGGPSVLFPGPEGWELWAGPVSAPVCMGPAEEPRKLRPAAGCAMGLPARAFFSLPIWVPKVEESPAREQTQIKLEMKGMLGASPEAAIWNCEVIRQEQLPPGPEGEPITRQLESTAVLATPFQEEWVVEEAARYEPAGRMLIPPGTDSLGVLRKELGRWVADFYLGGKWLHTQPLLSPALDSSAAVELGATLAQLEGEAILPRLEGWLVRDGTGEGLEEFRRLLKVPVKIEGRAPPHAPVETWNLPPPALTELRAERAQGAKRQQLIRAGLTGYLVMGFLALSFFAWPLIRWKLAQAELGKIGSEAEKIRSTAMLWREAGPWLEPRRNALELLWQVSRPLIETDPAKIEGVRLTLFDLNAKRLLLQGEGKDLELVEKYLQWLKNEPALAGFTWKNPQPQLLPNGNARFQAEGIPPGVSPDAEEGGANENPDAP